MSKELIERMEAEEADEAGIFTGTARVVPMAVVKPIIEKLEAERDALEKAAGEEAKKYLEEREKRIAAEADRDALAAELKGVRVTQQSPTTDDINLQNWKGMDGACAWHLIDRHADDWNHVARLMNAWLEANREDLVGELKALREQAPVAWNVVSEGRKHGLHRLEKDARSHVKRLQCHPFSAIAIAPTAMPLYAHPARELTDAVDDLAQHIRQIDGNHSMGAGALAESIAEWADRYLKGEVV